MAHSVTLFFVGIGAGIGLTTLGITVRNSLIIATPTNLRPSALRCPRCGIDWPRDARDYGRCPACLLPTHAVEGRGAQPLDRRAARSIRLHHEFERFYAAREREGQA